MNIGRYLTPEITILDIDTGGGEFLLSLGHPHRNTAATENYPPNVELCREVLLPLGVDFRPADGCGMLPFDDGSFDVGALVWFARIIQWEFPEFSVDACLNRLLNAQRILEPDGYIEGRIHRFLLVAKK